MMPVRALISMPQPSQWGAPCGSTAQVPSSGPIAKFYALDAAQAAHFNSPLQKIAKVARSCPQRSRSGHLPHTSCTLVRFH
jgi:hypothetical protein